MSCLQLQHTLLFLAPWFHWDCSLRGVSISSWRSRALAIAAVLIGAAYTYMICAKGIPILRHDWSWPSDAAAFRANLVDSSSGWSDYGFGGPRAYPIDYALNLVFYLASWIVGPLGVLILFAFATGTLTAYSADVITSASGAVSLEARLGAMLVAAFNPWCYNQIVAGHVAMIFALAGLTAIVGRALSGSWKLERDIWLLVVTLSQLQFFLFAAIAAVVISARTRDWKTPVTAFVLFLPVLIGVVCERHELSATPYL
jgi:hypothetical protein